MTANSRNDILPGRPRRALLALLLALAAGSLATGCGSSDARNTVRAAATQAVPVAVATARRQDMPVYLVGLGSVTPLNTVSVKSRVDGQLVEVHYKEGQQVRKGQLLAIVDPRPFEVQLAQAQAMLSRDQAQLRDAQLNRDRYADLFAKGVISRQQLDTQQALADQLEGTVRNDQAQIDNARLQITYCHITSPIDGRVGLRLVDIGNIVHANDQNPVVVITQLQPVTVVFTLPEDQLPEVSRHLAKAPLAVEAYSRDNQAKLATGTLLTIDNQIDPATGTGKLKAQFDNRDNTLWPNQFVNVKLLLETRKDTILVPAAAIQRGPQGSFAYVVKPDSTVEVRPVTIALTQENVSAIDQGLAPGDVVVTDGQDKLQAGSRVSTHPGNAPAAPAGAAPGGTSTPQPRKGSSPR